MGSPASVFTRAWEWINMLSIDVCAGALAGGIMAATLMGTSPGLAYWLVLPIAVWLIYTTDHLIDGYRAGEEARHKRHILHIKYTQTFIIVAVIAVALSAFIAFTYLPATVIRFGLILGILAMVYLFLILLIGSNWARWLPKEILVAAFYTAGIWGPVVLISTRPDLIMLIPVFIFFLLAFEDLLLLSFIEAEDDRRQGLTSMALVLGRKKTLSLFHFLSALVIILTILTLFSYSNAVYIRAGIVLLIMQIMLILISVKAESLRRNDMYRYLSEATFFLPALMAV